MPPLKLAYLCIQGYKKKNRKKAKSSLSNKRI